VNAHVGMKYLYVRILRGTKAMHSQSMVSRVIWAAICVVLWIISWIIAEAIPVFNDVLGLAVRIHQSGSVRLATNKFHRARCLPAGSPSVCRACSGYTSIDLVGSWTETR
jgi:hypothetical protein